MSEERLSKLQKVIIKSLSEKKEKLHGKKFASWPYQQLCVEVAEKTGSDVMPALVASVLGGATVEGSFRSTFSQSIRNLQRKGLVDLYGKGESQRVGQVCLTDKALSLNLNKIVKNKEREVSE